jgi:hypothetical protein
MCGGEQPIPAEAKGEKKRDRVSAFSFGVDRPIDRGSREGFGRRSAPARDEIERAKTRFVECGPEERVRGGIARDERRRDRPRASASRAGRGIDPRLFRAYARDRARSRADENPENDTHPP